MTKSESLPPEITDELVEKMSQAYDESLTAEFENVTGQPVQFSYSSNRAHMKAALLILVKELKL